MKKFKLFTLSTVLVWIFSGCSQKNEEISTNPQNSQDDIHIQSTLSTENSTNVDKVMENSEEMCISTENSSAETENSSAETENSSAETENGSAETKNSSTEIENSSTETEDIITDIENSSTETEYSSIETEDETEYFVDNTAYESVSDESDETVIQNSEMSQLLADAEYYYSFYSFTYRTFTHADVDRFDKKDFMHSYRSISKEELTDYFKDISWLMREDGISLSMVPSDILFPENNESAYMWMSRCIHAFQLISQTYSEDENWDNPDSLKPQFHCHAVYARQQKTPWNIEPYRTETDFLKIVLAKGNPDL